MHATVSVLITTYNYRQFVAEAIDSALAQSQPPTEILVIDDGSSDGTAELVRTRYANQPTVRIHTRENRGQLASFVEGAQLASGDVLAFLDADDVWQPNYLERVLATYAAHPAVNFVYTNMRFFGARQGTLLPETHSRDLGLSVLLGAYANQWQASATSALSLHRNLALQLLDIPEHFFPKWRSRADNWLAYGSDILGARKYYLSETLVNYRAHGSNAWLSQPSNSATSLRHKLNSELMLAHYRNCAGLSAGLKPQVLRYVKHEFRTKPNPTWIELKRYSRLLSLSSLPWEKRIKHRVSMCSHYWKTQHGFVN